MVVTVSIFLEQKIMKQSYTFHFVIFNSEMREKNHLIHSIM